MRWGPPEIIQAKGHINNRARHADFSVSEVAEKWNMSDSKLSVEFKRYYNITPFEYLNRQSGAQD